jgi:hypothetical protein
VEVLFTTITTTTITRFSRPQALVGLICHCDLFQVDPPKQGFINLPSELLSIDSSGGGPAAEAPSDSLSNQPSDCKTDMTQHMRINYSPFEVALDSQPPVASMPPAFDHETSHINQGPVVATSTSMLSVHSGQSTAGKLCTSALFGTTVSQVYPIPYENKTSLMFVFGVRHRVPVFKSAMLYISSGTGSCSTTGRLLPPPLSLFRPFRTRPNRRIAHTCRMLQQGSV